MKIAHKIHKFKKEQIYALLQLQSPLLVQLWRRNSADNLVVVPLFTLLLSNKNYANGCRISDKSA